MFNVKCCLSSFIINLFLAILPIYSQKSSCEVISYITHCEIRNNRLTETDSIVIQINDRTGEQYTNISLPYSKNQKVTELKAWIEDAFGRVVRKLKNSEVTEKSYISDFSLYEDDFVKSFSLKHNEYPYRVVYKYQTSYKQFIGISWNPIIHYKVPTKQAKLSLIMPKGFAFRKDGKNIQEPDSVSIGDEILYRWRASYLNPIHDELFAPSLNEFLPCLYVIPNNFLYGVEGSARDWASLGNWQFRLMKGLDELPDNEKNTIIQLTNGIREKREIVRILYYYMQDHTRYINVSIGIGGLKPYPASYVSINKYGDCKALTNYMKSLLKYVGIQSYYTVVYGGDRAIKVDDQIPGPQYFNHIILTVPTGTDTIWLENTSNTLPFGYTGSFTQNRKALLVNENGSKLIHIPSLTKHDVLVSRKIAVEFNKMGDASLDVQATLRGDEFEGFNSLNSQVNDTQKDELIRKWLSYSNFDLIKWSLNKKDRDSREMQLQLNMTFYKYLKSIDKESYFSLVPMDIPAFEVPRDRKLLLEMPFPIYKIDTMEFKIPSGYVVKTKPEEIKLLTVYGTYDLSFLLKNEAIQIVRRFELYTGTYGKDRYSDFYKYIIAAKEADKTKIVIKRKE